MENSSFLQLVGIVGFMLIFSSKVVSGMASSGRSSLSLFAGSFGNREIRVSLMITYLVILFRSFLIMLLNGLPPLKVALSLLKIIWLWCIGINLPRLISNLMYVNGSNESHNGTIGAGSVIRNSDSEWIHRFTHHIGVGDVLQAEIWRIFIGLKTAMDLHIMKLEIDSDYVVVVSLLHSEDYEVHPLETLINNCCVLMRNFDYYTFRVSVMFIVKWMLMLTSWLS